MFGKEVDNRDFIKQLEEELNPKRMTNLTALLSIEIHIECPQCRNYLNLMYEMDAIVDQSDFGQPHMLVDFFQGESDKREYDVECKMCECKFKTKIEY